MARKVLLADDEPAIRELLTDLLTGEGYEVIVGSDGRVVAELALKKNPQVILLDVNMPNVDGIIEACRRIREEKKIRLTPVIMMTGLNDHKKAADEAKADGFVDKPFDLAELLLRVQSIQGIGNLIDAAERLNTYMDEVNKNRLKR
jgi:DNA-binding response OmpR family regulator